MVKRRRETAIFYLFISPWLVGLAVLFVVPIGMSLYYSLTSWNMVGAPEFVGLANYRELMRIDPRFWRVMYNTAFYTLIQVPIMLLVSFVVAVMLNQNLRGRRFFRGVIYVPSVLPVVVLALVFVQFFKPNVGMVNRLLALVGIDGPNWLQSTVWAKPALIVMSLWRIGLGVVLLLAAMQGIPKELFEMAELEGANRVQTNARITLPMVSPVVFYVLITGMINALKTFTEVQVLTGGGPNYSSQLIVPYIIENAFTFFRFGYANAISWILFVIVFVFTLFIVRRSEAFVHYEAEVRKNGKAR